MANEMAELFARDPREQTDADIEKMILHLREMRHRFVFEGGKPKPGPKTLTENQQKVAGLNLDIKL